MNFGLFGQFYDHHVLTVSIM